MQQLPGAAGGDDAGLPSSNGVLAGELMLPSARAFLLGVQGLVQQHLEVGLVP